AAEHRLHEAKMRLFHPIGAMLASPTDNAADALSYFPDVTQLQIEDKYDGIRAQVHIGPDLDNPAHTRVAIFSRTMDEITPSFPELAESLRRFGEPMILDGEILAWELPNGGNATPRQSGAPSFAPGFARRVGQRESDNTPTEHAGRALPF